MKPRSAKKRFLQVIKTGGGKLATLTPSEGIERMLAFYCDERADGCDLDQDGDMLLYQWGCYDWGNGEAFEFNITRQLMVGGFEDENIRQLSLTFKFEPDTSLRKAADGNRWCRLPKEIDEFRSFIHESSAWKEVANATPTEVTLGFDVAG